MALFHPEITSESNYCLELNLGAQLATASVASKSNLVRSQYSLTMVYKLYYCLSFQKALINSFDEHSQ